MMIKKYSDKYRKEQAELEESRHKIRKQKEMAIK